MKAVARERKNDMKPSGGQQVTIAIVLAIVCGLLYFFIAPILGMIWTLLHMNEALFLAGEDMSC